MAQKQAPLTQQHHSFYHNNTQAPHQQQQIIILQPHQAPPQGAFFPQQQPFVLQPGQYFPPQQQQQQQQQLFSVPFGQPPHQQSGATPLPIFANFHNPQQDTAKAGAAGRPLSVTPQSGSAKSSADNDKESVEGANNSSVSVLTAAHHTSQTGFPINLAPMQLVSGAHAQQPSGHQLLQQPDSQQQPQSIQLIGANGVPLQAQHQPMMMIQQQHQQRPQQQQQQPTTRVDPNDYCRHFMSGRCNRRKCRFQHDPTARALHLGRLAQEAQLQMASGNSRSADQPAQLF